MSKRDAIPVFEGQLFSLEHVFVEGRELPYEFVRRIGATTVLPITEINGEAHVLAIRNNRAYYGLSLGLPGGNQERGEHPTITGLRELREETGYGYPKGAEPNVDTFLLRPISNTVLYDRHVSVVRGVVEVGGKLNNPREQVEVTPVLLGEYLQPILGLRAASPYAELTLALAKASLEVGEAQVVDWLEHGNRSDSAEAVVASFSPWMTRVSP